MGPRSGNSTAPTELIVARAHAGVEQQVLGDLPDLDTPHSVTEDTVTARAFRTGDPQIVTDQDHDASSGCENASAPVAVSGSAAAIPIAYENAVFGVLTIHSVRPNAFTAEEGSVIELLGEIVGHAIAAIERKYALLADDVIELEFVVYDYFDVLGVSTGCDAYISFDRIVPTGTDEFAIYGGRTTGAGSPRSLKSRTSGPISAISRSPT